MILSVISLIIFSSRLAWLKHQRESVNRSIAKAQHRAQPNQREDIWHERHWEIDVVQHAIQALQTRYYRDVANRKGIPIPDAEGDWEENLNALGTSVMSVPAIARLRSSIRQDQKELREIFLPIGTLFISVLALVVAFLNYRKPVSQPQPAAPQTQIQQPSPTPPQTFTPQPTPQARNQNHNPRKATH
jgi:hypothetical protein